MTNLNKERVLITGSNGFIAHHLIKRLNQIGTNIFGTDRSPNKNSPILNNNSFFEININNYELLQKTIKKIQPTIVFHLATNMDKNIDNIRESIQTNVIGTLNILEALQKTSLKHFIFLDTSENYSGKIPFTENSINIFQKSSYSLSKYQAGLLLQTFHHLLKYPITILRPSIVYGPNQKQGMFIPSLISTILNNKTFQMTSGEQTRDFIYVEDLIEGMLKVLNNKNTSGEIINLGSGKEYKIKEIALKIAGLMGKDKKLISCSLPYRKNEQIRYCLNIKKAKKILKWEPTTPLEEGLKKTINWYKNNEK